MLVDEAMTNIDLSSLAQAKLHVMTFTHHKIIL